jgi:hypothetical protein
VPIELRDDQWPVCFIQIDGDQTIPEYERYIESFNRLYDRKQSFAVVSYIKSYRANTHIVKRTGSWFKETEPLIKKYWVSNAIFSSSPGFRFLLGAVYLIKPLPIANKVCASADEAIAFTRDNWSGKLPPLHWPF